MGESKAASENVKVPIKDLVQIFRDQIAFEAKELDKGEKLLGIFGGPFRRGAGDGKFTLPEAKEVIEAARGQRLSPEEHAYLKGRFAAFGGSVDYETLGRIGTIGLTTELNQMDLNRDQHLSPSEIKADGHNNSRNR